MPASREMMHRWTAIATAPDATSIPRRAELPARSSTPGSPIAPHERPPKAWSIALLERRMREETTRRSPRNKEEPERLSSLRLWAGACRSTGGLPKKAHLPAEQMRSAAVQQLKVSHTLNLDAADTTDAGLWPVCRLTYRVQAPACHSEAGAIAPFPWLPPVLKEPFCPPT